MENSPEKVPMHQGAKPKIFQNAQRNRKQGTAAEKVLWEAIRSKKLDGYKFRYQHPVGLYIADFYCHDAKLIIELDGGYHNEPTQKLYDEYRTDFLNQSGITVIRFPNEQVLNHLQDVLNEIRVMLVKLSSQAPGP
jgi:very-short-patch-repair endonuclease